MSELNIDELREKATELGIKFSGNTSAETLAGKIEAAGSAEPKEKTVAELKAEAAKLIRIRISCMNPAKSDWPGEIITAGNRVVGTHRKFIPFTLDDEGYHVPQIILNALQRRKYQQFYTERTKNGVQKRAARMVKEFNIDILPPLTREELEELKKSQAARG